MAGLSKLQEKIMEYLQIVDPKHEIVLIDTVAETIRFNVLIVAHQQPKYEPEGFVRAYLITRLVKDLEYPIDCIEIENDISVNVGRTKRQKGKTSGRCDVTVFRRQNGAESLFLGVECKTPEEFESGMKDIDGQLWGITKASSVEARVLNNVKYLCLYTCELIGEEINDKAIIIDFSINPTKKSWESKGKPSYNSLPKQYGEAPVSIYANIVEADNKYLPLNKNVSVEDFNKLRDRLHNLLWAGASMDDNTIFYQLVKIFLIKIFDELYTEPDSEYDVQIRSINGIEETAEDLYKRLEKKYIAACKELLNYSNNKIQKFPFRGPGFTDQKLKVAIREIQSYSLTENTSTKDGYDILGSFFEKILTNQEFFKQSKGCFFTHRNIVRFIIAMLQIDDISIKLLHEKKARLPYIIDPSCGSGTFLIEAMKYITARVTQRQDLSKLNKISKEFFISAFRHETKPNIWAADYLYGIEPRPELGLSSKVNMILHGDGNMNIFIEDGLHPFTHKDYNRRWKDKDSGMLALSKKSNIYEGKEVNEGFDVVITNPPFSVQPDGLDSYDTHYESFLYGSYANSENLFLERHYQLLREGGRLAVVLPESVFDTTENKYIRLFLFKYFWIDAVVSLPQETFAPYTSTKTSILFATKKSSKEVQQYVEAWNNSAQKYSSLRKSQSIQLVLDNHRSKNMLIKLCEEAGVQVKLTSNLLSNNIANQVKEVEKYIEKLPEKTSKQKNDKNQKQTHLKNINKYVIDDLFGQLSNAEIDVIRRFTRLEIPDNNTISAKEICEKYYDEILETSRLDWPDYDDKNRYSNSWWCFSDVTEISMFDNQTFYAEVENIGYKRTKRGENSRPNELFNESEVDGFPLPNIQNPSTVLDYYIKSRFKKGL